MSLGYPGNLPDRPLSKPPSQNILIVLVKIFVQYWIKSENKAID